jgi:hypothetical protein
METGEGVIFFLGWWVADRMQNATDVFLQDTKARLWNIAGHFYYWAIE